MDSHNNRARANMETYFKPLRYLFGLTTDDLVSELEICKRNAQNTDRGARPLRAAEYYALRYIYEAKIQIARIKGECPKATILNTVYFLFIEYGNEHKPEKEELARIVMKCSRRTKNGRDPNLIAKDAINEIGAWLKEHSDILEQDRGKETAIQCI